MRAIILLFVGINCFGQDPVPRIASNHLEYRHILPKDDSYEQVIENIKKQRIAFKNSQASSFEIREYFLDQFEHQVNAKNTGRNETFSICRRRRWHVQASLTFCARRREFLLKGKHGFLVPKQSTEGAYMHAKSTTVVDARAEHTGVL